MLIQSLPQAFPVHRELSKSNINYKKAVVVLTLAAAVAAVSFLIYRWISQPAVAQGRAQGNRGRRNSKAKVDGAAQYVFNSASVQPYFMDRRGEVWLLLGRESKKDWADFGGGRETDDSIPFETAARELVEESIGALADQAGNLQYLNKSFQTEIKFQQTGNVHVFYLTEIEDISFARNRRSEHFRLLQNVHLKLEEREKTELAWIKVRDIVQQRDSHPKKRIEGPFTLYHEPDEDAKQIHSQQLRPVYLGSLGTLFNRTQQINQAFETQNECLQTGFSGLHGRACKIDASTLCKKLSI